MKRHHQEDEDADAIEDHLLIFLILKNYQKGAMLGIEMFTLKDFVHEAGDEIGLSPANTRWNESCWLWGWFWFCFNLCFRGSTTAFFNTVLVPVQFRERLSVL